MVFVRGVVIEMLSALPVERRATEWLTAASGNLSSRTRRARRAPARKKKKRMMADQPPPNLRRRLLGMRPSDILALSPSARENAYHPHVLLVIK